MASSSSSSSLRRCRYDVFLSFRGEDTRYNFTDHLYFALNNAGINVFRDDNELRVGENISTELLKAIEGSRISVIVFSKHYAASTWCLEELVKILDCRQTVRQLVFPIFYKVDPSDVRKQKGNFAEAFAKHEERFIADKNKVLRWRDALCEVANLKGFHFTDRYEGEFIKEIVEEILNLVNNTYLNVAIYPVGLDSHVQKLDSLLSFRSNDVRIIGICAMGGMGKTTIAKSVYNHSFHCFKHKSFLANVREISKQPNGQVHLQEQLLSDILEKKNIKVSNVHRGINVIEERLCNMRVLVVLDDVDQLNQLRALAGQRDWFGFGSRIIITTRDEHLLRVIGVDDIYMVKELNDDESLELFSWHAFRRSRPKEDYAELSKDITGYCKGLPLALEVLGSFLFERSAPEWKSALDKLQKLPHDQIQEKLRISYDALPDDRVKDIFLDIACFFIGVDKDYAVAILDGCGFFTDIGIRVLIQRSLLTINEYNKLAMHDLLRDMGREIVRKESPKDLGNRSRLWCYDDSLYILKKHKGTTAVEGLVLKLPTSNKEHLSMEAFAKMDNLRFLQLNYVHLSGNYDNISEELRWLCWHGFPEKFVPNNFQLVNLVAIDMQYSNLRHVWKEIKVLEKLKVLNLSHSHYLTKTPNFSQLPNLEQLKLKDCTSLVEVHPSIGYLHRLVLVNMRDCKGLKNLPTSICKLKSLKILKLSGCVNLEELPEDLGEMEALIELLADDTAIRQVPYSIVHLKNLKILSLCGWRGSKSSSSVSVFCSWVLPRKIPNSISLIPASLLGLSSLTSLRLEGCTRSTPSSLASIFWSWVLPRKGPNPISLVPDSLLGLSSLTSLRLENCNLPDEAIPKDLGSLSSLEDLNLGGNSFHNLPASISNLSKLRCLVVNHCTRLQSLPELPTSLIILCALDCISLERFPNLSRFRDIPHLELVNCQKLVEIPGIDKLKSYSTGINMDRCYNLASTFKETLLQLRPTFPIFESEPFGCGVFLPGNEIPSWFQHLSAGPSISFQVPPTLGHKMTMVALCFVYAFDAPIFDDNVEDFIWVSHFSYYPLRVGDQVEVVVEACRDSPIEVNVKKCGVYLYDDSERSIQYNSREWNEFAFRPCGSCFGWPESYKRNFEVPTSIYIWDGGFTATVILKRLSSNSSPKCGSSSLDGTLSYIII